MPEPGKTGQNLTDPTDKICALLLPAGTDISSIPPEVKEKIIELILAIFKWLFGKGV
jgi:hypothetical protein